LARGTENALNAHNKKWIQNSELEPYTSPPLIKSKCAMVTGDWHIPLHCPSTTEHLLLLAKKFKPDKLIIVGDLGEQEAFKVFIDHTPGLTWSYEKDKLKECLTVFLEYFKEIHWLIGNHELRMWKRLQGAGDKDDFYKIYLHWEKTGRIKTSTYPWAIINDSWLVCHPKSYSRVQARNPYFLASKHLVELIEKGKSPNGQYGLIGFHGHMGGSGTDISGRFQVADGMGMFEPDLFEYYKMKISTGPAWRKGFYMLRNNYMQSFPEENTDWDYWLGGVHK
jgi:hypothetical protein